MTDTPDPNADPLAGTFTDLPVDQVDKPQYETLEEWIDDWLAPVALRDVPPGRWCAKWWAHPDAVARFGALWSAWEAAWAEGGVGPSRWWVVDWEGHRRALLADSGTFSSCSIPDGEHREVPPPMRLEPVPAGHEAGKR